MAFVPVQPQARPPAQIPGPLALVETDESLRMPSVDGANICSMPDPAPIRRSDALPADYPQFLAEIKARIAGARTRAVLAQAWPDWEVCSQAVSKPP